MSSLCHESKKINVVFRACLHVVIVSIKKKEGGVEIIGLNGSCMPVCV